MVTQYKCPSCGSNMGFDSKTGVLLCENCGYTEKVEEYQEDLSDKVFAPEEAKEYHCDNCGGNVMTEADTTATACVFCGSNIVLSDRLSGTLMPEKVIPFTISKDDAVKEFREWTKKGRLAPNRFKEDSRIKEVSGMYVPFWMYDLNSKAIVKAAATSVRTYTRGDYIYTETKHYEVYRDLNLDFLKVPVDASEKMDDKMMDLLEPYEYKELKSFKTPYLAGYLAEKYNFDSQELLPRVKEKVSPFIDAYISSTISGYSTVSYRSKDITTNSQKSDYVLLPVWLVYYHYEDEQHIFAMNGQTGKVVGKPPISKVKVAVWSSSITVGTFLIMRIITMILGGGFL